MKTSFMLPAYVGVNTSRLEQFVKGEIEDLPDWAITLRDGTIPTDYYPGNTYMGVLVQVQIPSQDQIVAAELVAIQAEIARQSESFAKSMTQLQDRKTQLTAITHQES